MLFNSLQFGIFFVGVLVLVTSLPARFRTHLLLAASLVFYTLWVPEYLLLLLADVLVNYWLLRRMRASSNPRAHLIAACVFTLGVLGYFKYTLMAVRTIAPFVLAHTGIELHPPQILLPLGISFYSFQILALTIDTYRGQIEPIDGFARYLLFVCFFPQLIAGPILRGGEFLPQLARGGEPTLARARRGVWLIAVGLAKKVVLADFLLAPFVDHVFAARGPESAPFHLIALYSFAFQIYYDFSGYCDMARGMALLLGFEIPFNFLEPYLSRSPSEFWRRWHITLSRWLSDYLYVPLGGNRMGRARTLVNLMLTMLLGGLWHGSSWNFVVWGGLHGLWLVLHRLRGRRPVNLAAPITARDWPRILLVFNSVCLAWVFFRAETFASAVDFLRVLLGCANPYGWPVQQTGIVLLCIVLHVIERLARTRLAPTRAWLDARGWSAWLEGALIGAVFGFALLAGGAGGEFIYFQF